MGFLSFEQVHDVAESSRSSTMSKCREGTRIEKAPLMVYQGCNTVLVGQSRSRWDLSIDGRHLGCSVLRFSSRKDARGGPFGSRSSAACKVSSLRCSQAEHRAVNDNSNH